MNEWGLNEGEQAPSFEATDIESNTVSLDNFRGQRCVLAFISSGCSACVGAIATLNTFLQEQQDVAILVVGGSDSKSNFAFAQEHRARMPIWAPDQNLERGIYRVLGVPFVFVLDERGIIQAKGLMSRYEQLERLLTKAFASKPTHH